eukprot:Rmarinus@m.12164
MVRAQSPSGRALPPPLTWPLGAEPGSSRPVFLPSTPPTSPSPSTCSTEITMSISILRPRVLGQCRLVELPLLSTSMRLLLTSVRLPSHVMPPSRTSNGPQLTLGVVTMTLSLTLMILSTSMPLLSTSMPLGL